MKTIIQGRKLPYGISEYIRNHFTEDFLFEVKDFRKVKGNWEYMVEVTKDDIIHTLRFDERGVLVREEAEPAFPPDSHDGNMPDVVPE